MKSLRVLALSLVACGGFALPSSATSITYEYLTTAADGGPGAGILYTLEVDTITKAASLTITGSSTATDVWRADWFSFKWAANTNYELTNLVAPAGSWAIADYNTNQTVKVVQGNTSTTLLESSRSGFYLTSVGTGGSGDPTATGSVCLAPGTGTYSCTVVLPKTFTFNIGVPDNWTEEEIPFKVGYYDGVTGSRRHTQFITNKLSRELEELSRESEEVVTVPDGGATIGLLGVSLVALGLLRRMVTG